MKYEVTLRSQRGESQVVTIEADSGDAAAEKAFKPYHVILSIQPAPKKAKAN
jgi:hypothetical protein